MVIQILWADDQVEVVKSFGFLLEQMSARHRVVKDGLEAVQMVKSGDYDVILLDLKMPPGEWGGLWALEEIRKLNKRIPVVIVSGEGTQTETIRALRLGAQDYVLKDRLQEELPQRIKMVLGNSSKKAEEDLANHFPGPISIPFKRYLGALDATMRLHRLLEFFESYLRFCCIVGICELQHLGLPVSENGHLQPLIRLPSMGSWEQARGWLAKHLPSASAFSRLNSVMDGAQSTALIRIRNDIAHGSEPSESMAAKYLGQSDTELTHFSRKLWQNFEHELLLATKLQFDGERFAVDVVSVMGSNLALQKTRLAASRPLVANHPYLYERDQDLWIDLFPFVILEESAEPSAWKILVFDGLKMDRNVRNLTGSESIRYIDISSGQRNLLSSLNLTAKLLPGIATDL